MFETVVTLKPEAQWRPGLTWEGLIAELDERLRYPRMPNVWWMPIQTRTEMLATGLRSNLGIKLYGPDLATLQTSAVRIERALQEDPRTRPYTRSAFAERLTGGYFLDFVIDRDRIARYGLTVGDVEDVIETAVGGLEVSRTVEGRERYAIRVRYARDFREDPEALDQVLVTTPGGAQVPLAQLARPEFVTGADMLRNEDGQLVSYVFVDVKDLGVPDYVQRARQVLDDHLLIPAGYRLAFAGQYQSFERAKARLQVLVPATLLIVLFILLMNRSSLGEALVVMLAIPFSLIGAVWCLYLLDYKLSVAVGIGMIALAGLAVELGVLMLLYLKLAYAQRVAQGRMRDHLDLTEAIVEGAVRRLRPKLMTAMALLLGLMPILWGTGTGADVMKRIAAPMAGGILSALLMTLLVFPAIYAAYVTGIERRLAPDYKLT